MRITPAALKLSAKFNQWAARHEDSYVLSAPYYLLTGRKGVSVYSEGDTYVIVCRHPHIEDHLLVFPEIGGNGTLTCKILNSLPIPTNGIQLARYSDRDFEALVEAGRNFPHGNKFRFIEREERIMDWKYPIHILNTGVVSEMRGSSFEKLRNKYNKACENLAVVPLSDPRSILIMRSSLMFWAGSMIYAGKETGHDLMEFYTTLFNYIQSCPDFFDGFVLIHNGEPAGFTIWDKAAGGTANGIAGLSRKCVKGMSEFQTVTACRTLAAQGISHYNIGGSETEGLDQHKQEYRPEKSIQVRSYDVEATDFLAGVRVETWSP